MPDVCVTTVVVQRHANGVFHVCAAFAGEAEGGIVLRLASPSREELADAVLRVAAMAEEADVEALKHEGAAQDAEARRGAN